MNKILNFNIKYIIFSLFFLNLIDIFLVKNFDFIFGVNFGERVFVNFLISNLAIASIIYIISSLKIYWQLLIISLPLIIESNYFNIYNKMINSFGLKTFLKIVKWFSI